MRSLKASPQGLKKIKESRETRGLAIDKPEWLEEASNILEPGKSWQYPVVAVSIGTWKRFLKGTPVKPQYFKAFCQVLQINWEEVVDTQNEDKTLFTKYDWNAVPDVSIFFDRSIELNSLKQWIINDKCRLVIVLAMGGVGKMAVKLAQEVNGEFDYIIWRSLREAPTLEKTIADIIKFVSEQREIDLPETNEKPIDHLRTSRCLLILDNAESIL